MGKRKKSSRKPATPAARRRDPLDTTFTCLFCNHEKSVNVKIDKKEGTAQLSCKVCGQRFQGRVNHLTEPIDVYSEWIDAADAAQNEADAEVPSRSLGIGGSSRPRRADFSDED